MKKTFLFLLAALCSFPCFSQDITGEWHGTLEFMGQQLPVVFYIEKTETGYSSKMDSPKQSAFGIQMASVSFQNDSLRIEAPNMGMTYTALWHKNKFVGTFSQRGFSIPLELTREKVEAQAPKRPQEPEKPYPYYSEEVFFENNKAGITLAGTLTMPDDTGKFPAVILISGSGPQNRNEEIMGHKPFLVLSDYLTRHGIAVLRYDDRGTAESEGDFSAATTADFATDAKAALDYLLSRKEIDKDEIGLIGHSEGGMIAPMVAAKTDELDFLVLLAGPGIPLDELLVLQNKALAKASGMTGVELQNYIESKRDFIQIFTKSENVDSLKIDLTTYFEEQYTGWTEKQIRMAVNQMSSPWWRYFLEYEPSKALKQTNVPVLAINGGNDLQVPPEVNLKGIETALKKGGNNQVTTKILPGLNHLFQESQTGLPSEYGKIEQTFSPVAMGVILSWIKKQTD